MLRLLVWAFFCATALSCCAATEISTGSRISVTPTFQLPVTLPLPTSDLDASVLPSIPGQTLANVAYSDVRWNRVSFANAFAEVSALNATAAQAGFGGVAIETQATPFRVFQTVLGFTVTCSGTLVVSIPRAGLFLIIASSSDGVRATASVRLDGITTALSFDSGICAIAANYSPQLKAAVEKAIADTLSAPTVQQNINDGVTRLLNNLTNTQLTAAMVGDTLMRLLNSTMLMDALSMILPDDAMNIIALVRQQNATALLPAALNFVMDQAMMFLSSSNITSIADTFEHFLSVLDEFSAGNSSEALNAAPWVLQQIIDVYLPGVELIALVRNVSTILDHVEIPSTWEEAGSLVATALMDAMEVAGVDVAGVLQNISDVWALVEEGVSIDDLLSLATDFEISGVIGGELQTLLMLLELVVPSANFSASRSALSNIDPLTVASLQEVWDQIQNDVAMWIDSIDPSMLPPVVTDTLTWLANYNVSDFNAIMNDVNMLLPPWFANISDVWALVEEGVSIDDLLSLATDFEISGVIGGELQTLLMLLELVVPSANFSASRSALSNIDPLTVASLQEVWDQIQNDVAMWIDSIDPSMLPPVVTDTLTWLANYNVSDVVPSLMEKITDGFATVAGNSSAWKTVTCIAQSLQSGPYRLTLNDTKFVDTSLLGSHVWVVLNVGGDQQLWIMIPFLSSLGDYFTVENANTPANKSSIVDITASTKFPERYMLTSPHSVTSSDFELPLRADVAVTALSLRLGATTAASFFSAAVAIQRSTQFDASIDYLHNVFTNAASCLWPNDTTVTLPPSGTTTKPPATPVPTTRAPPPQPQCPFVCPGGSACATSLANCTCTLDLVLSNVSASFIGVTSSGVADPRNGFSASGAAVYEVHNTTSPCVGVAFNSLLVYRWEVSATNGTLIYSSTNSRFTSVPSILVPGAMYIINLTVRGIQAAHVASRSWVITIDAPAPIVSITRTAGSSVRLPSASALIIPTFIVDPVNRVDTSTFEWSCVVVVVGGTCPTLVNQSVRNATIASGALAGEYNITFTYRGEFMSVLNVVVFVGVAPSVRIVVGTNPVIGNAAVPLFATGIILSLAASVKGYNGTTNATWFVNGVMQSLLSPTSDSRVFSVNTSDLLPTPTGDVPTLTAATNSIRAVVTAANDSAIYGEATVLVGVLPASTMALAIGVSGDSTASTAHALTDTLSLTVSGALSGLPASVSTSFAFFVLDGPTWSPLTATVQTDTTSTVLAPPLAIFAKVTSATTTFSVVQRLNGYEVGRATAMFNISRPTDLAAAIGNQIALAGSVGDAGLATQVAGNLGALMSASTNATAQQEMASAVGQLLQGALQSGVSTLTSDQQGSLFGAMTMAVSLSSTGSKGSLQSSVKTVLSTFLAAGTLDPANGKSALGAIATLTSAQDVANLAGSLAQVMANDAAQAIGEARVMQVGNLVIAAVKQVASALANLSIASTNATMTLPSTLTLPGIDSDAVIGVSSTSLPASTFGSDSAGASPSSAVVSFVLTSGASSVVSVEGLAVPITVTLELTSTSSSTTCKYWDETGLYWSTAGVVTVGDATSGTLACQTTHLTSFATFGSGASSGLSSDAKIIGAIVGGIIGGVIVVLVVIFVARALKKRDRKLEAQPNDCPPTAGHPIELRQKQ